MAMPSLLIAGRPAFAILIEALAGFSFISFVAWPRDSRAFSFLERQSLQWNGRVSYSFYLWHYFLLSVVCREFYAYLSPAITKAHQLALFTATLVGTIAVALAVAHFSYKLIEVPFVALGKRVVKGASKTLPIAEPAIRATPEAIA